MEPTAAHNWTEDRDFRRPDLLEFEECRTFSDIPICSVRQSLATPSGLLLESIRRNFSSSTKVATDIKCARSQRVDSFPSEVLHGELLFQ